MKTKYIIGLDLHGTLLEPGEIIQPKMIEPISQALVKLKNRATKFLCTGNDLEFVRRKIDQQILNEIDGQILETGCSMSPDNLTERILTTSAEQNLIYELDCLLRQQKFPEINYSAHRLTTISMFCDQPKKFWQKIYDFVSQTKFAPLVHITYSSVAVDILPMGYNKHKGLNLVANGKKTIGIADSMNDRALLEKSDFAFAPANLSPELIPILKNSGRQIIPINQASQLIPDSVIIASEPETQGVKQILELLNQII